MVYGENHRGDVKTIIYSTFIAKNDCPKKKNENKGKDRKVTHRPELWIASIGGRTITPSICESCFQCIATMWWYRGGTRADPIIPGSAPDLLTPSPGIEPRLIVSVTT